MRLKMLITIPILVFGSFLIPQADAQEIMELDAIVVEGRIQRPQASYILQRASVDFGINAKRKSFVSKIVESINTEPF